MKVKIRRYNDEWNAEINDIVDFSDEVYEYRSYEKIQVAIHQLKTIAGYDACEAEVVDSFVDEAYAELIKDGRTIFEELTITRVN